MDDNRDDEKIIETIIRETIIKVIGKSQKFILNPDLLTPEIRVKS